MAEGNLPDTVAGLMAGFRKGNKASAGRLVELLYPELRRLAAARMQGERLEHSWQPTLLVNELYLELLKRKANDFDSTGSENEREAFMGLAGFLMKRLLIAHSRPLRQRILREGRVTADSEELGNLEDVRADEEGLHLVEDLLNRLGALDPDLRRVVEMRVFEGLTSAEIGTRIGCSERTVRTRWNFARHWLQESLG